MRTPQSTSKGTLSHLLLEIPTTIVTKSALLTPCLQFLYKWTYLTDFSRILTRIDTYDVTEHSTSLVKVQRTFFESCKGDFSQIDMTPKNTLQSW